MYQLGHEGEIEFLHGIRDPVIMWVTVKSGISYHYCIVAPVPKCRMIAEPDSIQKSTNIPAE